jgi:ATP/maltotriose-dependent transcriptional regulator MalT
LAQEDLFIQPLDEKGLWYRYHRLFAGALRSRLEETEPDLIPELRRRAVAWYADKRHEEGSPGQLLPPMTSFPHQVNMESEVPLIDPLTERERIILVLIAQGLSNKQIADRLAIGIGTVKGHVNHLLSKLNAHSRTEAVARAQLLGLLEP